VNRSVAIRRIVTAAAALAPIAAFAAEPDFCAGPPGAIAITQPLNRTVARIARGESLSIVAIGSSTTVGVGASTPALSYPARLEVELRDRFPGVDVHVVNRGKSGEDAPEELARLTSDVVARRPDLAIWQLGTNAVLRRDELAADGERMRQGVALLKQSGIDVVLMDMQYAPRVIERPAYAAMEELIGETAEHARVGLFRRFALMRFWQRRHAPDAPAMIGADGLHMTDAGYGCLAADLAAALESNWRPDEKLARRPHRASDAVAGLTAEPPSDVARMEDYPELRRNDAKTSNR